MLLSPMFGTAHVKKAEPFIRGLVDELIDSFIDEGEIDFVQRFAIPLPMRMICGVLGFPAEDLERLKTWSTDMAACLSRMLSPDEEVRVARSMVGFQHYIVAQLEEKRRNPADDVLSHLAKVPLVDHPGGDGFTLDDLISMTFSMHIGGNESTTNALTSGLWLALENPEVLAELRADPRLMRNFVGETVRLETPFQSYTRAVRQDVEMEGVLFHRNDKVEFKLGAANRDPRRFEDPDRIDLHRPSPARHVAFSTGPHHCLGSNLARLEMAIAFEALFTRLADMRLAPGKNDFAHLPHFMFRGLKALHLTFRRAA